MREIIDIALQDLRVFLRIRSNLVFTLVIPLAMTFFLGMVNGGMLGGSGQTITHIDVIDNDHSGLSAQLIDSLRDFGGLLLCPVDNNRDDSCGIGGETGITYDADWARARLEAGTTQAVIVIPAGFSDDVKASQAVTVDYIYDSEPAIVTQALNTAILRVNGAALAARVGTDVVVSSDAITLNDEAAFSQALYDRADSLWKSNPVGVAYEQTVPTEATSDNNGLQQGLGQSVPGIGAMFVMFTVFGGMTTLIQERAQGTLQRLGVMPVSRAQVLAGKILGRFILGLLQYLVVFAMGFLMGTNFGSDPLALLLLIVLYVLSVTAISFALGSRLKNESQAAGLSLLLTMVLASLGGAWWPLEIVPEFMRILGHISPVAWAMDGFNELIFYGGNLSMVLVPIGVLLVIIVVCFALAVMRFRYD